MTQTTTLTREALLDAISARTKEVTIDGIGVVTIRSWSPVQRSRRQAAIAKMTPEQQYKYAAAFAIVDMVRNADHTPLFSEDDIESLVGEGTSPTKIDLLHEACQAFDEEESGNASAGQNDTATSSNATRG